MAIQTPPKPTPLPNPPSGFTRDPLLLGEHAFRLVAALGVASGNVLACHKQVIDTERRLADAETAAWTNGQVEGKNAEQRTLALRDVTREYRRDVERARHQLRDAQAQYDLILEELKTCRAILTAFGGRP